MAKGMSLSIGLDAVDPKHYGGWAGELNACEADAAEMRGGGTAVRLAWYFGAGAARAGAGAPQVRYRAMPPEAALRTYRLHKAFYDRILAGAGRGEARKEAAASILLISGCQDNQLSADGEVNGLFTGELLRVWKHGAFKGSYPDFHRAIVRRMPPDQTPNYFRAGRPSAAFERQRPFTV